MGFLMDTCVWIDVERGVLAPGDVEVLTHGESIFMSPVTLAALRFGAEIAADPGIRQQRLAALRRLEHKPLLPIDGTTGTIFGSLAAQIKTAGRQHRYRVQDLWLASQALQHACRLLTRNKHDFEDIPGLQLVLYHLGRHTPRA
ncbi:MAG TPA: type II toxin-antitoxin system VapC family toxin [Terriglobia bacterium]|nr:type II toxin-antitoxin system VapC family toxin [Terriglobia bacterium]